MPPFPFPFEHDEEDVEDMCEVGELLSLVSLPCVLWASHFEVPAALLARPLLRGTGEFGLDR